jgi:peroxiredoxin
MKWRSLEETGQSTDSRPLREILAERKALIAKYVPAETQAIHAQAVAELKQRHLAANILPVGAKAPQFELPDHDGKSVSSSDLLAKGRLVLCFIRGRWCPFCVGQMEAMNLTVPQIEQAGAALIAISPQTVKQSFFMRDQHKLHFPLLSDAGNQVARQFALSYRVPDLQQAVYRRAFVNLPFANGDDSWELPIPATYILDRDGTTTPSVPSRQRSSTCCTLRPKGICHPERSEGPMHSLDSGRVHRFPSPSLRASFRFAQNDKSHSRRECRGHGTLNTPCTISTASTRSPKR